MTFGGKAIEFLFSSPFPDSIGFSCKISEKYELDRLSPLELALLSNRAVDKRKLHFFLGRLAAKEALAQIGIQGFAVLRGENNEPLWPKDICGSITHTGNIGIACAAPKSIASGIGIDVEKITEKLTWDIVDRICLAQEKEWVTDVPELQYQRLLMVFSAKESIFKAFFPQNPVFFGFHEALLVWNEEMQSFSGKLLFDFSKDFPKEYPFSVGCRVGEGYIFTFLSLPKKSELP